MTRQWLAALTALTALSACTTLPAAGPATPAAVVKPSPIPSVTPAMLKLEPGRMFAYDVTTIRQGVTSRPGRTAYRIVQIFDEADFQADYRVVTPSGQVTGEDKITFTRVHGIFYPAYTAYHPMPEAYTETETLQTPIGPITAKRTSLSFLRPKAQTRDSYTYWIHDKMLVKQHLVSESDGEEITELAAVG
jgi:hypothetical protein